MRLPIRSLLGWLTVWACAAATAQQAAPEPPSPIRLPDLQQLKAPPKVRAVTAALGLGRQRLALVIAQSRVGGVALPAAARDAKAVAAALGRAGYVVMPREDLGAEALRATLKEFRARLTPGGAGLIYVAGAAVQSGGQNLLLTRDADPAAWQAGGVPLAELVQTLQITPGSLRMLIVDAAAPLPGLPPAARGLALPTLPDGVMALLSAAPGAEVEARPPPPLSGPPPADPRELAGSAFGSALVHALLLPRVTGPDALRHARRLAIDGTAGRQQPWIGGRTDEDDELGEPGLVESMLPATPEETALKMVKKLAGLADEVPDRRPSAEKPRPPTPEGAAGAAAAAGTAATVLAQGVAEAMALQAAATQAQAAAATAAVSLAATAAPLATRRTAGPERLNDQRDIDGETPKRPAPPPPAPAPDPAPPPQAAPAPPPPVQTLQTAAPALPRLNPYGYAAGDSFTYRRVDQWKGEAVGLVVQLIEQVLPDGEMLAQENDGAQALDAQGRVRSRSGSWGRSEFQPVEEFFWSRPKRGESRDVEFTEFFTGRDARGERRWSGEVEVGRPTRIDTPAGRFDVLPMEGEGWYTEINALGGRRSVMWERTVWYAPDLGHPVAIDIVERDAGSRLLRKERLELLQVQTSRTVPR